MSGVSPAGDVQIGLMDKKGQLEVEVIRARGLTPKPGSKSLPGTTQTRQLNFRHVRLLLFLNLLPPFPSFLPSYLHVPAPYVKVYLLDNGTCKAKKKTKIARKTLEPLYQQHLLFDESPQGKVLQVTLRDRTLSLLKPFFLGCMLVSSSMSSVCTPKCCCHLAPLTLDCNFIDSNNCNSKYTFIQKLNTEKKIC